jgi:excisionase family DNA binding protein
MVVFEPGSLGRMKKMVDKNNESSVMTPAEVAKLFSVDPKTVTRWAKAGKLSSTRTLGGHRRYYRTEVMKLYRENHAVKKEEKLEDVRYKKFV